MRTSPVKCDHQPLWDYSGALRCLRTEKFIAWVDSVEQMENDMERSEEVKCGWEGDEKRGQKCFAMGLVYHARFYFYMHAVGCGGGRVHVRDSGVAALREQVSMVREALRRSRNGIYVKKNCYDYAGRVAVEGYTVQQTSILTTGHKVRDWVKHGAVLATGRLKAKVG